jgi:hypothetical protein
MRDSYNVEVWAGSVRGSLNIRVLPYLGAWESLLRDHGANTVNPGEHENPQIQIPPPDGIPPPAPPVGRIQWNLLFRTASPLAIITGVLSALIPPIGLLLVLPLSLKRIIARYRPFHAGGLRASQGAVIGAFTALLSFVAFLVFFLPLLSVRRADIVAWLHDRAAKLTDPVQKQTTLWFTTNEGLMTYLAFSLVFLLVIFLVIGILSGAVITRTRKRVANQ